MSRPLGILMLNTKFPRIPGDIGNPESFSFPIKKKMVELAQPMLKNQYGKYLLKVVDEMERTGNKNLD